MVHNQLQAKDDCWRIDALYKVQPNKVHSKKMQYMKVHHGEVHHKEVHHEECNSSCSNIKDAIAGKRRLLAYGGTVQVGILAAQ